MLFLQNTIRFFSDVFKVLNTAEPEFYHPVLTNYEDFVIFKGMGSQRKYIPAQGGLTVSKAS
jgi:hypothetical protein